MKSLAVISCYFGPLPWYFRYYVHSCGFNPTVTFFIVTDDHSFSDTVPENVKLIYKTLADVSELASEKLRLPISIKQAYKMCDFKPAYGIIFSDLINGYDYWAHSDIDLIYGSIRDFITPEVLSTYDVISVRPDWIPGCFLIFKNISSINRLFENSKDYELVFTSDKHYCFDETNFAHEKFTDGMPYFEVATEIESMMHVVKKMEASGQIRAYFDLHIIEGNPGRLIWEEGKLLYRGKYDVLLYHLIRLKKIYLPKRKWVSVPDRFRITPTKIYRSTGKIN
ncbi:hypothetical protein LLH06_10860 [Mucilaginibacter daejeonensis]|uniref:DUF6625 family protein n=1 Tax=Mucilaginibacter daejeonensis TaxID=398049 RepID=UPI001D17C701|nr:DUF6625 family protein [Mucilaginibacter daejeonensis]UEG51474.1 hypothetical protein LLH06_10860 [Mucilaginibacter daejeonensis]